MSDEFVCRQCGECCRIEGQVRIGGEEIRGMAALLRLTEHDFIQQFTRLAADRQGLVLTDQPGGSCVFLEGRHCRVNEAKPIQCREFPSRWNNPGWERYCAGAKTITDFSKAVGL